MKKLVASLPCLEKLYIDAMQCTWNIYCLADIMQWISVAKELRFLTFKMRADQGKVDNFISFEISIWLFFFLAKLSCRLKKKRSFIKQNNLSWLFFVWCSAHQNPENQKIRNIWGYPGILGPLGIHIFWEIWGYPRISGFQDLAASIDLDFWASSRK